MRHDYYRDYTDAFKLAKRLYNYIEHIKQDTVARFDFFQCCKYLRWQPYGKDKDKKRLLTLIRHDYANEITNKLGILKRIGAIANFDFKDEKNNYTYEVTTNEIDSWEELVSRSYYFPLEGYPQEITTDFLERKKAFYDINYYQDILDYSKKDTYKATAVELKKNLSYEWEDIYELMKGKPLEQIGLEQSGFEFFLDMGYEVKDEKGNLAEWQNERVVAIAGFSKKEQINRKRNANRLAGYRKRFFSDWSDKQIDTGHFIAHTIWDSSIGRREIDLEFNLYAQKRALNQGHSEEGKLYRKMEKYCADNSEIFLFVRPIYGDSSSRPFIIEYGILKPDMTLWIEQFVNIWGNFYTKIVPYGVQAMCVVAHKFV